MATNKTEIDPGESFLREVDEELRRDQLHSFWQRYGRMVLIGIGVFLMVFAGFLYWRSAQQEKIDALSDRYAKALLELQTGDKAKAKIELEAIAKDGSSGLKALARLALAVQLVETGDKAKAQAALAAIAADSSIDEPFQQLATLRLIQLKFDTLKPEEAIKQLQPLAQDGQPWFGPAGELLAVSYLNAGKPELARALFESIAGNKETAPSLRSRAAQMVAMLPEASAPAVPAVGAAKPKTELK